MNAPIPKPIGKPSGGTVRQLGDFRIVAESRAAGARFGGDFCVAALTAQGRLAVVIGDACGHGAEGAALAAGLLPDVRELARVDAGPAWLLWELNRRLAGKLPVDRFATAVALELDAKSQRFSIANAGHVPVLVRRELGNVEVIGRPSGPPLGMTSDAVYGEERHSLHAGDVLVTMTDGVFESVENDLVGMRTLRQLIAGAGSGVSEVQRALFARLDRGGAGRNVDDDKLIASVELVPGSGRARPTHFDQVA